MLNTQQPELQVATDVVLHESPCSVQAVPPVIPTPFSAVPRAVIALLSSLLEASAAMAQFAALVTSPKEFIYIRSISSESVRTTDSYPSPTGPYVSLTRANPVNPRSPQHTHTHTHTHTPLTDKLSPNANNPFPLLVER